jgi:hypothetical protein
MAAIKFESKTCGRCGGSGHYSFNQINGTTCFGCGGTGLALTKRGKAARAKMLELQTRPVAELKAGEFFWFDPYPMGGKRVWATVANLRPDALNEGMVLFDLMRGGRVLTNYGMPAASTCRSVRDQAHLDATIAEALAYEGSLAEDGKPKKGVLA